jgi:GcrA cell cycle regulator
VLTRLWKAGDLSASQIARRLGVTRNAVLGKVHRLGLSGQRPGPVRAAHPAATRGRRATSDAVKPRRSPPRFAGGFAPTALIGPALPEAVVQATFPPEPDVAQVAHWEDLGPGRCCWPCGDPKAAEFGFCGAPAPGGPYCERHARRAYRPGGRASVSGLLRLADRAGA